MSGRKLLLLSLLANVALAIGWIFAARQAKTRLGHPSGMAASQIQYKTNIIVRRQFLSWSEVESPDYPTYIANLRAIDCPEQTIRDIVIADVNALYARRIATEIVTPEQQWWRSRPDTNVLALAVEKTKALDSERRALLAQLLGPNWEGGDLINLPRPSQPAVALDGAVLGILPSDVKQAVEQIALRSQQRIQDYLAAQQLAGKEPDPAMLVKLRQQTREELAGVLSPQQLEEYLLRYSVTSEQLRNELAGLKFFNASPDEFRKIFDAVDQIDQKIALVSPSDPNAPGIRAGLEQQRELAIKNVIGADRFAEYALLHDPLYRDAVNTAEQGNAPQAAQTIFEINVAAAQAQNQIQGNTNLTVEQREIELKRIELQQLEANAAALGQGQLEEPPLPPAPPTRSYTFTIGDNTASVAQRFGVSLTTLQAINPGLDLSNLRPGDSIRLPINASSNQ